MIDKRPTTPREVAAFSLFSMAEEAAWSDGALHHYLSRAGLDSRDAALASRLTYGTVQNQIYWLVPAALLERAAEKDRAACAGVPADGSVSADLDG